MKKFIIALVALIGMAVTSVNAESHTYSVSIHKFDGLTQGMARATDNIIVRVLNGDMAGDFYEADIEVLTATGEDIKELHITGIWGTASGDFKTTACEVVSKHGGYILKGHISLDSAGTIVVTTK